MTRIEKSIVIEAPVEKVFAFVNDFDNFIKTQLLGTEFEILSRDEGPQRVGFTLKVRTKIGDRVWEIEVETTEYVENERISSRQKGGAMKRFDMFDTFESTDGGDQVDSDIRLSTALLPAGQTHRQAEVPQRNGEEF